MSAPPRRPGASHRANGTNESNRNGAFTSVNARRSLAPQASYRGNGQPTTQAQTSASPPVQKTTFPDKLKEYVARTFEDCPPHEKAEVELELKRIITDAFNEKVVWSLEWDQMPLPQTILARKKEETRLKATPAAQISPHSSSLNSPNRQKPLYSTTMDIDEPARKRKSATGDELTTTSPNRFEDRFEKRARRDDSHPSSADRLSQREKDKRAKRFEVGTRDSPSYRSPLSTTPEASEINKLLVGRCQDLEKQYFRLTSAPNPDHVRPLHVLEKTLEMLKKKWRTEQNYSYICDQFKSLRQDLTVQHIKSDFTVLVYEIHARIALEKGDLGEYNQCQTQLFSLYREGLKGHEEEFKAYRILYLLHTRNQADMNDFLAILTPADKQGKAIRHALAVRAVLAVGNFHKFFRLYLEAPMMGGYLMDSFIARERISALCTICKGFLTEELGFESDTECVTFLYEYGAQDLIEQKSNDKGVPNSIRFQTTRAIPLFEGAKLQAFKKVDIKGQL